MSNIIDKTYGNRIRNRVCGICIQDSKILLINHQELGNLDFWCPAGGGIEFGESAKEALIREFSEETGLKIIVHEFLHLFEFIKKPLHAYEFFFLVKIQGGKLEKGFDPEMSKSEQIIKEVKWVSFDELKQIPNDCKHHIFHKLDKDFEWEITKLATKKPFE